MKACADCMLEKPTDQFYKNRQTKDGLHVYCKDCVKRRSAAWKRANPDAQGRWRANLLQTNPNYFKEYHVRNAEKTKRRVAEWAKNNRDKRIANENKRRAAKQAGGYYSVEEWTELCEFYDNKCLACGATPERLSPDHVIPLSKGGRNTIDNIQPLCLSCNLKKNVGTIDYRNKEK